MIKYIERLIILEQPIEDLVPIKIKILLKIINHLKIQMFGNHHLSFRNGSLFKNITNQLAITPILAIKIIKLEIYHQRKKDKKVIIKIKKHF